MNDRVSAWENGEWVRDAAMAYAKKQEESRTKQAM